MLSPLLGRWTSQDTRAYELPGMKRRCGICEDVSTELTMVRKTRCYRFGGARSFSSWTGPYLCFHVLLSRCLSLPLLRLSTNPVGSVPLLTEYAFYLRPGGFLYMITGTSPIETPSTVSTCNRFGRVIARMSWLFPEATWRGSNYCEMFARELIG